MSSSLMKKGWVKTALTLAIATFFTSYANAEQMAEVQQLRAEVQELRALIQQQSAVQVTVTPANTAAKELKLTTAGGAEAKLYGFVRADVSYQADGGESIFNRINAVALDGKHNDKLYSTVNSSRIGVDFKTPVAGADIGGKVEVDFRDDGTVNPKLRLRHGYLTYDHWLMGQTTSTFSNLEVIPEMLDFNLNLGSAYDRRAMLRYSEKVTPDTQVLVGLEQKNSDNRLPTLTAKVNHNFAQNQGLISGRVFVEQNRAASPKEDVKTTGWGAGIGASYKFSPEFKMSADYMHVEGNQNLTMFANTAFSVDGNDLENNVFDVASVGATYQINPQLRSTVGYGVMQADDGNRYATLNPTANKELQQGWVNLMYAPSKPLMFGVEYVHGERETFVGVKGQDNRVGAMARYSF